MNYIDFSLENHPEEIIQLEENLFLYMDDSFNWIPTIGSYGQKRMGLDYIGVAIVNTNSSLQMLKNVFHAWKQLFEIAPETFVLTGMYVYSYDEYEDGYEKNSYSKKEVIRTLDELIEMTTKGIETNQTIVVGGL